MNITIERAALLRSLAHIQSVVERRNTIPILSNVLIEAAPDSTVRLMATDLDLQIIETMAAVSVAETVLAPDAVRTALAEAREALEELDALIHYQFAGNAAMQAGWASARRLDRVHRRATKTPDAWLNAAVPATHNAA